MADTKVSQLTAATTLGATDFLMLVQSGNSMKIDIETLALKMPTRVQVLEAAEDVTVNGALATNKLVSTILATTGSAYTLAVGAHGAEKIIVCSAIGGTPNAVVTVTGGKGFTTLTFNAEGNTVTLKNINASWYVMSTNNVVVA